MLKKIIVGIIISAMIITSMVGSIFVFAETPAEFKITGEHKIENVNSGTRNIILENIDTGNKDITTINVNSNFEFTVSNLINTGTYTYKLYQEPITSEGLTQDLSVYTVELYVTNNENIIIIKDKNGNKPDKIEFIDKYVEPETPAPEPEPEPEPTPDPKPEPQPDKPFIKTLLTDKSGNKSIKLDNKTTVIDTVTYKNLPTGSYELLGVLMDKKTNKATNITGTTTFKVTEGKENGTAQVIFTFDSTKYEGKDLVAFETLYTATNNVADDNLEITDHRDINDKDQTISIKKKTIIERITPNTGDSNNILIWSLIYIFAIICVIIIIVKRKFKK